MQLVECISNTNEENRGKVMIGRRNNIAISNLNVLPQLLYLTVFRGGQTTARGPHAALESTLCGPRTRFETLPY